MKVITDLLLSICGLFTAPASSADLSAITSDPDGDTVTHWWLVKSAPGGANPIFSAQGKRSTTVSNLLLLVLIYSH